MEREEVNFPLSLVYKSSYLDEAGLVINHHSHLQMHWLGALIFVQRDRTCCCSMPTCLPRLPRRAKMVRWTIVWKHPPLQGLFLLPALRHKIDLTHRVGNMSWNVSMFLACARTLPHARRAIMRTQGCTCSGTSAFRQGFDDPGC